MASSDVKQFFRIIVSGYVCLLYYAAMLLTYSKFPLRVDFGSPSTFSNLISIAVSGLALSVPIGFLIHESDVFLYRGVYRPIVRARAHAWIGALLRFFQVNRGAGEAPTAEQEAFLESVRYSNPSEADAHLDKEVSNRWSYFYARLEAGIYAPLFALLLFEGTMILFSLAPNYTQSRLIAGVTLLLVMVILLVGYCPRLMREINAIDSLVMNRIDTLKRTSQFE
jgi:hypothetical protein